MKEIGISLSFSLSVTIDTVRIISFFPVNIGKNVFLVIWCVSDISHFYILHLHISNSQRKNVPYMADALTTQCFRYWL